MNKKKITTISAFIIMIAAYWGVKMYASGVAKEKIDEALAGITKFAKVEYANTSVGLLSRNVYLSDVTIAPAKAGAPIRIDEVVISDIDQSSRVPTFLEVAFNGIEIALADLGHATAQTWKDLGISDKIKLDLAVSYQYQSDSNQLDLKKLSLRGEDLGELNASLRVGNLPIKTNNLMRLLFTYPKVKLHNAKISYRDDSLLKRTLESEARKENKSVDDLKKQAIAGIEEQMALANNDIMREALAAVKNFIADPDELSISIAPEDPISIQQLMQMRDPARVTEALKLSVKN